MQVGEQVPKLDAWRLLRIWAGIGMQSFGGGASTIFLIQREFVEKGRWLTMEEFTHLWNLCIMTPGINLIAITILIGRKLGGAKGIAVSLLGMLLPSVTITCLITAGFQEIEQFGATQAVLKGVIPATAGIMLLVGLRFAQPQVKTARQEGWVRAMMSLALVVTCFVAIVVLQISAALVLVCAGLLGIVLFRSRQSIPQRASEGKGTRHD